MSASEGDRPPHKRRRREHQSNSDDNSWRKGKGRGREKDAGSSSDTEDEALPAEDASLKPSGSHSIAAMKSRDSAGPRFDDSEIGGQFAYRAVYEERVALGLNQSPCTVCPVFDFCREEGRVNPRECVYYETWLSAGGA